MREEEQYLIILISWTRPEKKEPTLRHYCKKTLEANIIKIYRGDDVVIKVEEEDEATAYRQAQSRLESLMR
jgi:hypothetical protein